MSDAADRGDDDAATAGRRPRSRRRIALLVLVLALASLGILVRWATRPQQVASVVLSQAGRALGLEITARGVAEYRLRGMPRIVLRDVDARVPGDSTPVLRAERILLSLPWSTLRSRGRDLVVHRVELDAPRLDIRALQRWQATRPDAEASRVPRLTDGLVVRRGRVDGDGWHVESIDADVPSLAPDAPLRAHVRGRVVAAATRIPFDVRASLARPAEGAGLGIAGAATLVRPDWRLELALLARGRPRLGAELGLDDLVLGADARYAASRVQLPFVLGIAGRARYRDGLSLAPFALALRQGREVPDLDGAGQLSWARALGLSLQGSLHRWPAGWPALPDPLSRPRGPLPFSLDYLGPVDFSGLSRLELREGDTRLQSSLRLPRVLAWLESDARGTPLPPLDGRLTTPRLEVPGMTLHGLQIEIDDGEG
jgi:hypothetical protein